MSLYSEVCPILREQKVGPAETGYHWTEIGDIKVDNQAIIDACNNCQHSTCWHECKGKEREREFSQ